MALFQFFRELGVVCAKTPISLQKLGNNDFLTVSVGKTFQIYDCEKIKLVSVGTPIPLEIDLILSVGEITVAACQNRLVLWRRNKLKTISSALNGPIVALASLKRPMNGKTDKSPFDLVAATADALHIYTAPRSPPCAEAMLSPSSPPTAIALPPNETLSRGCLVALKRKVLCGCADGTAVLMSARSQKVVYAFASRAEAPGAAVTAVAAAGVEGVAAVAYADGCVVVLNLRFDAVVARFKQCEGGAFCLSFSDCEEKEPLLATTTPNGNINVWSLNKKSLDHVISDSALSIAFLKNSARLVAAGSDNRVRVWEVDATEKASALLKSRGGHSEPPSLCRFYGDDGVSILSASPDRALRLVSVARDEQNVELSQGNIDRKAKRASLPPGALKLPPVVGFCSSAAKEREWCNVVTAHSSLRHGILWSFERKAIGERRLKYAGAAPQSPITAVGLSACGHFALLGSAKGVLFKCNAQSALYRGEFADDGVAGKAAHAAEITAVAVTALNGAVASASLDGTVKFWDFRSLRLLKAVSLAAPALGARLHRASGLLGVFGADGAVSLLDARRFGVVRRFGHGDAAKVNAIAFRPDGRLLVTATDDGVVRVFDVPSAQMIDWFRLERPVVDMDFSPDGRFLVTALRGRLGLRLWTNKSYFFDFFCKRVDESVAPAALDENFAPVPDNGLRAEIGEQKSTEQAEFERKWAKSHPSPPLKTAETAAENGQKSLKIEPKQKTDPKQRRKRRLRIATFSEFSADKWANIAFIDSIRERNKLVVPAAEERQMPFFLNLATELAVIGEKEAASGEKCFFDANPFLSVLKAKDGANANENHQNATKMLLNSTPSQIDLFLRFVEKKPDLIAVCAFFERLLARSEHFEAAQACLYKFIKLNAARLIECRLKRDIQSLERSGSAAFFAEDLAYLFCMIEDALGLS